MRLNARLSESLIKKLNTTGAQILDFIYHITLKLLKK